MNLWDNVQLTDFGVAHSSILYPKWRDNRNTYLEVLMRLVCQREEACIRLRGYTGRKALLCFLYECPHCALSKLYRKS